MGGPQGQVDYFISYTSTDRIWAEWIAWQLKEAGSYITASSTLAHTLLAKTDKGTQYRRCPGFYVERKMCVDSPQLPSR